VEARARVALVTGASSGLGAEMARQLASRGWHVALLARRVDRLAEVARDVEAAGPRALALGVDVTDETAVRDAVARVERELGVPDLVMLNAGVGLSSLLLRETHEDFARMQDINVVGAWNVARHATPSMVRRGSGRLVGISSQAAFLGLPGSGGYAASKAALARWLESVAIELHGTGVEVTVVHPGFIESELTATNKHPMPFLTDTETGVRRLLRGVLAGRRRVVFPRRLHLLIGIVRRLPLGLRARILRGARGSKARPPADEDGPAGAP